MSNHRIPRRARSVVAAPQLQSKFNSAVLKMLAEFIETAEMNHAQSKGNSREIPVRSFFEQNLPATFAAVGGEIVDISGEISPQMDVIIYNKIKNSVFTYGLSHILPAEAPLVTIEVKSQINTEEIKKSLLAAQKLKCLRPLQMPIAKARTGGVPANEQFRYMHCVFAYSSNLVASPDALKDEYARIEKVAAELRIPIDVIDRIYVINKGLIMPSSATGVQENDTNEKAKGLFELFLHVMNFALREDERRPAVDFTNYTSRRESRIKLK